MNVCYKISVCDGKGEIMWRERGLERVCERDRGIERLRKEIECVWGSGKSESVRVM